MLNDFPRQQLGLMIQKFGIDICHQPKKCEAILRDLCPEYQREIHLLISALNQQVVHELQQADHLPLTLLCQQCSQRLQNQLGIHENFADWAIESWVLALGFTIDSKPPAIHTDHWRIQLNQYRQSTLKWWHNLPSKFNLFTPIISAKPQYRFVIDRFKQNQFAIKMVYISGNRFIMGSPETERNRCSIERLHSVTIADFVIGQYPVTFADYDLFVQATRTRKPQDYQWGRGQRPVIDVSWQDAIAYTHWLSEQTGLRYRLPTEAEWEYACRAGTETAFFCGDKLTNQQAHFNAIPADLSLQQHYQRPQSTITVGHFPANPFGIYDMCGNVWEWTASAYSADYNGSELRAANDNDHEYRMLRGGSWKDSADHLRSACRIRRHFTERTHFIGFRIARDN